MNQEVHLLNLSGAIEMEHPNKLIDSFSGVMELDGIGREPILPTNVLLRGCVLRNTDYIIGIVVNTGHDTKIMMSANPTRGKTSKLESESSNLIKYIIFLLIFICFVGATGMSIWNKVNDVSQIWYLHWSPNPVSYWFVKFFYFFLLHATYIPVSLYVSMATVRFFQSWFINNDLDMYHESTDNPALTRTMTLNEELGQISYIFSDKTGTLTCNVMDFRKASINGASYGVGITEIGRAAWKLQGRDIPKEVIQGELIAKQRAVPHVSFYCPVYERHMTEQGAQSHRIQQFFRILSLCHDVIPERIDGKLKLSASSPDDEALVCAAAYFGFEFCDRQDRFVTIRDNRRGVEEEIEILETIEFSSRRKRMSVVVRDTDRHVKILTKGADSVIMPRLRSGQDALIAKTDEDMRSFAAEGLRCLLVGYAEVDLEFFEKWRLRYKDASSNFQEIENMKRGMPNKIEDLQDEIERDIELLGCTGIEDKLQDGVPDCIAELSRAGINIWILTGDKEETAINIAVACNLVQPDEFMAQIIVNKSTAPTVEALHNLFVSEIEKFESEIEKFGDRAKPRALIIDGSSLLMMYTQSNNVTLHRDTLLRLAKMCKAVVCCRVSPDQKREMVNLIKSGVEGARILAVGDGANDVAMIQEAHIGVGIKGEEGVQAVNAADYAIAQFRFLSPLVIKHGRYNYIRMSNVICFMFYKNVLMATCQFWFNFFDGFSGQKFFTEAAIQLFNVLFTMLPLVLYGIYDRDISSETVHRYPQVYKDGIHGKYFNRRVFFSWIWQGVTESVLLTVLSVYDIMGSRTKINTHWAAGALCFSVVVIVCNLKMFLIQNQWMWVHYGVLLLSVLLWFLVAYIVNSFTLLDYDFFFIWNELLKDGVFWLAMLVITSIILLKDFIYTTLQRLVNPSPAQILQEIERKLREELALSVHHPLRQPSRGGSFDAHV